MAAAPSVSRRDPDRRERSPAADDGGDEAHPLDCLELAGPGLLSVALSPEAQARLLLATLAVPAHSEARPAGQEEEPEELWSRTIGALGAAVWRRLARLRIAVVGTGRAGALAAQGLLRLGARHLALIDPDTLEASNVGEMEEMRLRDIGMRKALALADALRARAPFPGIELHALAAPVTAFPALAALKRADILFCCVDNPAARLATQLLATLYLRPLIDIGTGIFRDPPAPMEADAPARPAEREGRRMGADVRLLLPERCLLCFGGIADFEAGRQRLLAASERASAPGDWRMQRAGSLHALNAVAAGHAVLLLTELAAERLARSAWLHLEIGQDGLPTLERRDPPAPLRCPLCAQAGRGDAAIADLARLIRAL